MRPNLAILAVVLGPVHCKEYGAAFKFVGGFFGMDAEREERPNAGQGLRLIGAGFSRTGTKSAESALLRLGHKIYDTRSMLELKHVERWVEAAQQIHDHGSTIMVGELLAEIEAKGYTATLDFPMNLFSKTFAELRPEAKVLFTTRDLDKWFNSWRNVNQILGCFVLRPWSWLVDFTFAGQICKAFDFDFVYPAYPDHIDRLVPWFDSIRTLPSFDSDDSRAHWIEFHERIRRELETSLPSSRFLAFDVRQGWAPLLKFLEIDDPILANEIFPNVNDVDSLRTVRRVLDGVALGLPLWLGLVLYLALRGVRYAFGGSISKPKIA
jgi:hypothetical protein